MKGENFYEEVQKKPLFFLIYSILAIVFFTGITFTFVIPGLQGFNWYFFFIALLIYIGVANIFVGLFKERLLLVFILSLIFSALGMGWRLWLEWGEFSLVEHMNPVVLIGYPCIIAFIILFTFHFSSKFKTKK
ncbi:ABC transporter permease [Bacillus sp. FJAT-22090]|uniref:ABC transporter permease n=1 Tax=Bacillus sp. FJAT-22090 TaxID=1581038 RepID=UPI00119DE86E|nr:ABC transporter permease [Bacillus sp. FJAT-22090]